MLKESLQKEAAPAAPVITDPTAGSGELPLIQ